MIMFLRGFRFGLFLQLAIGPVCIFVLKTAIESGVLAAEAAVLATTIVDAIFVTFAIAGIGIFLDRPRIKRLLNYLGAIILIYFGVGIILGSFEINIIPGFDTSTLSVETSSTFVKAFILTASNPLTILFWTGVFASKITHEDYNKKGAILFGIGTVFMTLTFLSIMALLASLLGQVLTNKVVNMLNIAVGAMMIVFAVKRIFIEVSPSMATSE